MTFQVPGFIMSCHVKCLVDSGASISLINSDIIAPEKLQSLSRASLPLAVGANGSPLHVMGKIDLPVKLGNFESKHSFVVVDKLVVDCILGADFLFHHGAVLDCSKHSLHLCTSKGRFCVPFQIKPSQGTRETLSVVVAEDVVVEGRHMMYIPAQLRSTSNKGQLTPSVSEGLVEPLESMAVPDHVLCAHSLCSVDVHNGIIIQVLNGSREPVKLYKGTKIALFHPLCNVLVVDASEPIANPSSPPDVKIDWAGVKMETASLSKEEQSQLKTLLGKYAQLFSSADRPIGRTSVVKHDIITEGQPIRQKYRRLPEATKPIVVREVHTMLEKGVIRRSVSPWSSPIVLVRKKDGNWRFCIDFRKVNFVTHKDAYPLPKIEETLDSLSGAKYFSTLDLASGYWQVELKEEAKEKTAFSTPLGLFEFNVMPFGLTNAPATFQRLMECVLAGLSLEQCLVYLDDIIVFSKSFEEHLSTLESVFQRIDQAGLTFKLNKCHFCKKEVKYLGHIVSSDGIMPDPEKISGIESYPIPRDLKQLQQFLGLTNYYRRFIDHYSDIAAPLYELTRKTAKGFCWTPSCTTAFQSLKAALSSPPVLSYPSFHLPFILSTDASDGAIGAVLSQSHDGEEHPVAYWSRQLQKAERNYSTIEREALAVVSAIKHFYPYLYGHKFSVVTDHNPLTTLKGLKDVGGRIARWILFLQQFDMEFCFKPGKYNTNADTMSRVPVNTQPVFSIVDLCPLSLDEIGSSQKMMHFCLKSLKP